MFTFTIDIEPTNRCNAKCHFCPRDMTPHQGLMSPETFDQALGRAIDFRAGLPEGLDAKVVVSLCGLGEPLLNRHTPSYVSKAREAGFDVSMSSNGALLDERRSRGILDGGLQTILINVGEKDEEYEAIYKLPFDRTRDNIVRFAEEAKGQCEIYIVLVDHRQDAQHIAEMKAFWKDLGFNAFVEFEIMNRGGALFVDHMQYESMPEIETARDLFAALDGEPLCGAPFGYPFVGYDGQYYLCCSDWVKEYPLGSVFDRSIRDLLGDKMEHVTGRATVCRTCNLDPLNQLTADVRAHTDGEPGALDPKEIAAKMVETGGFVRGLVEQLAPGVTDLPAQERPLAVTRRLIPVSST